MDHYLEISIRPDPELSAQQILNVTYAKLHTALVQLRSDRIGVSFPDVDPKLFRLGSRIRLHGTSADLERLTATGWLAGMYDYVKVSGIAPVPSSCSHRSIRRIQVKSNPERLRRRLMRRHGFDEARARERIPDDAAERSQLPYVQVASSSTGQKFRLFIEHGPIHADPIAGAFNAYGLGQGATVPWF